MYKKITNVLLVENPLFNQAILRYISERTFSLTSTNVLTSPNNIVLIKPVHRGQARGTPERTRSLNEVLDEMNETTPRTLLAAADTIDRRRERIRQEVHDFFDNFNRNALEAIDNGVPRAYDVPYELHPYLWEGGETLEEQLQRQLPWPQPEVLSITQELEAMETSETEDSNASTVVDDLAHIDARVPLASPTIDAPDEDEDVNSNDDTLPMSSYGSDETFD